MVVPKIEFDTMLSVFTAQLLVQAGPIVLEIKQPSIHYSAVRCALLVAHRCRWP